MSMLPVGGLAAPEQAVAVSAKAETNSGDSASGFAQVLSQQSEKGAVAAQGEGKVQDAPGVVRSSTEGQLLRKGEAGPMQQAGTSAQAAASSQKTRIEPHGKDQRAFAGSTRELVEGPVMHGLPANPSGLQLVGRSAEGSSATKTPAVKMSPVNPALLLSDDEAKKDVKNGKVFKNAANGDTPLPILLVPANLSIVTPEGGKANAEVKSTQSGRLPHDLLSNGILRSHQASSGSTPSDTPLPILLAPANLSIMTPEGGKANAEVKSTQSGRLPHDLLSNGILRSHQASSGSTPSDIATASELFRPALATDSLTGTTTGIAEVAKSKVDLTSSAPSGSNSLFGILQMPQLAGSAVAPAQVQLSPSLQEQPAWGQALAQGVQWMAQGGVQQAVIHLHPEHLGPLVVQLELGQNGQASAVFLSAHADVRAAISAAVPQLQQNFAAMGLNLGQASVGSGWSGSAGERRNERAASDADDGSTGAVAPVLSAPRALMTHQGLLSTFV